MNGNANAGPDFFTLLALAKGDDAFRNVFSLVNSVADGSGLRDDRLAGQLEEAQLTLEEMFDRFEEGGPYNSCEAIRSVIDFHHGALVCLEDFLVRRDDRDLESARRAAFEADEARRALLGSGATRHTDMLMC